MYIYAYVYIKGIGYSEKLKHFFEVVFPGMSSAVSSLYYILHQYICLYKICKNMHGFELVICQLQINE